MENESFISIIFFYVQLYHIAIPVSILTLSELLRFFIFIKISQELGPNSISNPYAISNLGSINHIVFNKAGTVTDDKVRLKLLKI
jgi:magnesium-transporting ATPase (P-type)